MKRFFPTLFLALMMVFSCPAQQTAPEPTPPPQIDPDVVKISTNLIQVDVSVTDRKGKPVADLRPEDFEVFENGKKQEITNFSFISAESESAETEPGKKEKNAVLPPASPLKPEQVRRTIALVVDDLTLSFTSTYYVRRALRKFVDEQMTEGDLVAVIRTGAGIGALQQFTSDKRLLYAAIEKIRWNQYGTGGIGAFAPIESNGENQNYDLKGTVEGDEDSDAGVDPQADLNEFRENVFAAGTLGAINYIVQGMRELPGRKSIMLLSDGFSLFTNSDNRLAESSRVLDALRRLVDQANRSAVIIYTIDARGLVVGGLTAADNVSSLTGDQIEQRLADRRNKLFDSQEGLIYLAKETGGFPIINNNDIAGGIRRILDDQSYYLIGYQPDEETFDPEKRKFNKLEIKVKRKDLKVRYRSGFFGISDEDIPSQPVNRTPEQQILTALTSPFGVSGINLNLNTVFSADNNYKTSLSSFLYIDLRDLKFTDGEDGLKKAAFDLLAVTFGDNGVPVDQISKTYTLNIKENAYQELLKEGFVYYFTLPIEKPGAYQMRVAIRDHGSEKLGAASQFVEVPKLKKKRLTLSGMVLENLTIQQWKDEAAEKPEGQRPQKKTDPILDTAFRSFKRGTVLRYGFEIYNFRLSEGQKPELQMQARLYRDGKVIFEGKPQSVDLFGQTDPKVIKTAGALSLGRQLQAGDYVLQVIVTDPLAKRKYQTSFQFVQFELVD
ncbi:MAG: VWA domain-containing protein [Pyrinomonadaceae bacterium]